LIATRDTLEVNKKCAIHENRQEAYKGGKLYLSGKRTQIFRREKGKGGLVADQLSGGEKYYLEKKKKKKKKKKEKKKKKKRKKKKKKKEKKKTKNVKVIKRVLPSF